MTGLPLTVQGDWLTVAVRHAPDGAGIVIEAARLGDEDAPLLTALVSSRFSQHERNHLLRQVAMPCAPEARRELVQLIATVRDRLRRARAPV